MSLTTKRTLNDSTNNNNKRLRNDDTGQFKTQSFIKDDSMFDDDVFHDEQSVTSKSVSQNRSRKRLYGTSSDPTNGNKNKRVEKENILMDEALNQLREEQARIDAHSLSFNVK